MVGNDFHASAIVGAGGLKTHAEEFGIDADWVLSEAAPQKSSSAGKAVDPTAIVFNSQHVCSLVSAQSGCY